PGIVHGDVAAVPFADPEPALAVGPDATRALLRRRRLDDARRSRRSIDLREVVAGQRHVPDRALWRRRDPIGASAARRLPDLHLFRLGIEAADDAVLAGEPEDALLVEDRRVEVGGGGAAIQLPDLHLVVLGVDAGDGVLAAFRDPGCAVRPDR